MTFLESTVDILSQLSQLIFGGAFLILFIYGYHGYMKHNFDLYRKDHHPRMSDVSSGSDSDSSDSSDGSTQPSTQPSDG